MATQITPVMILHVELLTKIFDHVLTDDTPQCQPYQWKVLLDLTSVCSLWREICLGEPLLWTRIGPGLKNYNMIELFLMRSQTCLLTIHYCQEPRNENIRNISLLLYHSWRWLDVTLEMPSSSQSLLSSLKGPFPQLETLNWICDIDGNPHDVLRFSGFEIAPRLRRSCISLPFLKEIVTLPWSQLTHFSCQYVHSSSLHSTLPLMSNLSLLNVRNPIRSMTNIDIPQTVAYPPLSSLEVENCDFETLHSLLRVFPNVRDLTILVVEGAYSYDLNESIHLRNLSSIDFEIHQPLPFLSSAFQIYAPNLSEIRFASEVKGMSVLSQRIVGNDTLDFLTNLVSNACCTLTTLTLSLDVDFDCHELARLLSLLPEMEYFEIFATHGMDCIPWRSMTPLTQTLPKLKTFPVHIPCTIVDPITIDAFIAFVRSNPLLEIPFYAMD
ncbi:hypothetical protein EV360DRAFT_81656 [Lentinula raphanica]|nr:hypothetical protein EV360DRAFT_81656 [Lentinula raphanica]